MRGEYTFEAGCELDTGGTQWTIRRAHEHEGGSSTMVFEAVGDPCVSEDDIDPTWILSGNRGDDDVCYHSCPQSRHLFHQPTIQR